MKKASDRAYDTIRAMILSGELAAGEPVGEESLAAKCGVSRTPVRDAMRRLEADLLIRRTDSQRSFVADPSMDDVRESFELRAMLEGYAARRAAEKMTEDCLEQLKSCNTALSAAIAKDPPDVATFLDRNREFHALVLEAAGSPRLTGLLTALIEQPVVWRTAHHYSPEAFHRSHSEHRDLLSAFERGDGAWAETVMAGHILRAFHAYSDAHSGMPVRDKGAA